MEIYSGFCHAKKKICQPWHPSRFLSCLSLSHTETKEKTIILFFLLPPITLQLTLCHQPFIVFLLNLLFQNHEVLSNRPIECCEMWSQIKPFELQLTLSSFIIFNKLFNFFELAIIILSIYFSLKDNYFPPILAQSSSPYPNLILTPSSAPVFPRSHSPHPAWPPTSYTNQPVLLLFSTQWFWDWIM